MEKSALDFEERVSLVEDSPTFKVVPHLSPGSESLAPPRQGPVSNQRRRRKLIRFIKLEASALVVLVLALLAGTSPWFARPSLTLPFEITILGAALAVALIPVIFYGLPRPKYRYRGRRYYRH
ncbi:MAG TPA: hypothetical protein VGZ31_05385 [Chthoniobacterales bacterium]|jgi:hypothetical protein|nr:hypothetical protein [Chthoniobacterales bacterium]